MRHTGGYHPVWEGERYGPDSRYTVLKKLGWGHFSTVWLVIDAKTGSYGAMKVQKSEKHYTEAARDEITLLSQIRDHDPKDEMHCCRLIDNFEHVGPHGRHVCMVFEVLGDNLLALIKRYDYKGIPLPIVRNLCRQMLISLDYIHRELQIIHTDFKPENVMLVEPLKDRVWELPDPTRATQAGEGARKGPKIRQPASAAAKRAGVSVIASSPTPPPPSLPSPRPPPVPPPPAAPPPPPLSPRHPSISALNPNATSQPPPLAPLTTQGLGEPSIGNGEDCTMTEAGMNPEDPNEMKSPHSDASVGSQMTRNQKKAAKKKASRKKKALDAQATSTACSSQAEDGDEDEEVSSLPSLPPLPPPPPLPALDKDALDATMAANISSLATTSQANPSSSPSALPQPSTNQIVQPGLTPDQLLTAKCKLVDFGNACWVHKQFTSDIQTRQYRSPEVILGAKYSTPCDMWSLGCMIFELVTGDLLFDPREGEGYDRDEDHLALFIELLGKMPRKVMEKGKRAGDFFNRQGELRHIKKLKFWPLQRVLTDKYRMPEDEVGLLSYEAPNSKSFRFPSIFGSVLTYVSCLRRTS